MGLVHTFEIIGEEVFNKVEIKDELSVTKVTNEVRSRKAFRNER